MSRREQRPRYLSSEAVDRDRDSVDELVGRGR